jgi:hypothetical protein
VIGSQIGAEVAYGLQQQFNSEVKSGEKYYRERSLLGQYLTTGKMTDPATGLEIDMNFLKDVVSPVAKEFAISFVLNFATMGAGHAAGKFIGNRLSVTTGQAVDEAAVNALNQQVNAVKTAYGKLAGAEVGMEEIAKSLVRRTLEQSLQLGREVAKGTFIGTGDALVGVSLDQIDHRLGMVFFLARATQGGIKQTRFQRGVEARVNMKTAEVHGNELVVQSQGNKAEIIAGLKKQLSDQGYTTNDVRGGLEVTLPNGDRMTVVLTGSEPSVRQKGLALAADAKNDSSKIRDLKEFLKNPENVIDTEVRLDMTEALLGRPLTPQEQAAVLRAHEYGNVKIDHGNRSINVGKGVALAKGFGKDKIRTEVLKVLDSGLTGNPETGPGKGAGVFFPKASETVEGRVLDPKIRYECVSSGNGRIVLKDPSDPTKTLTIESNQAFFTGKEVTVDGKKLTLEYGRTPDRLTVRDINNEKVKLEHNDLAELVPAQEPRSTEGGQKPVLQSRSVGASGQAAPAEAAKPAPQAAAPEGAPLPSNVQDGQTPLLLAQPLQPKQPGAAVIEPGSYGLVQESPKGDAYGVMAGKNKAALPKEHTFTDGSYAKMGDTPGKLKYEKSEWYFEDVEGKSVRITKENVRKLKPMKDELDIEEYEFGVIMREANKVLDEAEGPPKKPSEGKKSDSKVDPTFEQQQQQAGKEVDAMLTAELMGITNLKQENVLAGDIVTKDGVDYRVLKKKDGEFVGLQSVKGGSPADVIKTFPEGLRMKTPVLGKAAEGSPPRVLGDIAPENLPQITPEKLQRGDVVNDRSDGKGNDFTVLFNAQTSGAYEPISLIAKDGKPVGLGKFELYLKQRAAPPKPAETTPPNTSTPQAEKYTAQGPKLQPGDEFIHPKFGKCTVDSQTSLGYTYTTEKNVKNGAVFADLEGVQVTRKAPAPKPETTPPSTAKQSTDAPPPSPAPQKELFGAQSEPLQQGDKFIHPALGECTVLKPLSTGGYEVRTKEGTVGLTRKQLEGAEVRRKNPALKAEEKVPVAQPKDQAEEGQKKPADKSRTADRPRALKESTEIPRAQEVLSIPDTHGDHIAFRNALVDAGYATIEGGKIVLTERGKKAKIVHTGDFLDRGTKNIEHLNDLKLLKSLKGDDFVLLAGNHEVLMLAGLGGDFQALVTWAQNGGSEVLSNIYKARTGKKYEVTNFKEACDIAREMFVKDGGEYTDLFRGLKLMHQVDDVLYVHAGLNDHWITLMQKKGIDGVNKDFANMIKNNQFGPLAHENTPESAPIWLRDWAGTLTPEQVAALNDMGIRMVVHGHQPVKIGEQYKRVEKGGNVLHAVDGDLGISEGYRGSQKGGVRIGTDGKVVGQNKDGQKTLLKLPTKSADAPDKPVSEGAAPEKPVSSPNKPVIRDGDVVLYNGEAYKYSVKDDGPQLTPFSENQKPIRVTEDMPLKPRTVQLRDTVEWNGEQYVMGPGKLFPVKKDGKVVDMKPEMYKGMKVIEPAKPLPAPELVTPRAPRQTEELLTKVEALALTKPVKDVDGRVMEPAVYRYAGNGKYYRDGDPQKQIFTLTPETANQHLFRNRDAVRYITDSGQAVEGTLVNVYDSANRKDILRVDLKDGKEVYVTNVKNLFKK